MTQCFHNGEFVVCGVQYGKAVTASLVLFKVDGLHTGSAKTKPCSSTGKGGRIINIAKCDRLCNSTQIMGICCNIMD